ncbi:MAG: carboxylesterase/lipase family protein [Candidatus Limnocylindrales bacterium]
MIISAERTTPVITTRQGRLRGSVADGVHCFKGVPYAAPPFGPDRFRPPLQVERWSGVRDALTFGAEPPQLRPPADHPASALVWDPATPGEDCLNLNIWTPHLASGGLPVMVWIPGGMFEVGTGATYDGSRFARDGIVCVTINYRVGAEGFLYVADGDANLGLLDQIAALEWVRDNIGAFGGDPAKVTIFGESAGAMSVGTLLSMPRAQGLFQRAIAQSGAADRVVPATIALQVGRILADRVGVAATREAVAAVSPDRLLVAAAELKDDLLAHPDPARWGLEVVASALPWQPVVDGDVIPDRPIVRIARGAGVDVDLLVGTNTDDWALFLVASGAIDRITDDMLTGAVVDHGYEAAAAYGLPVDGLAGYRAAYPGASPGELLAAIQTDWWCRIPALRLADAHVGTGSATYMYEFAWRSPVFGGRLGACHALEIGFVFDTLDRGADQMLGPLLGDAPPQGLADTMHRAWVAFAATGEPGWPKYDRDRRLTMRFDTVSRVVDDPRAFERALWGGAG